MPTPIRLPAITSDFAAGRIAGWHKAVGDLVQKGDVLFEVESDKAMVAVEAEAVGVLGSIRVPGGSQDVPVDTIVGFLLKYGETEADIPQGDLIPSHDPAGGQTASANLAPQLPAPPPLPRSRRIFASPLARRIAAEGGVDLSGIEGRGPNGRILKADVEAGIGEAAIQAAFDATPSRALGRSGPLDIPHSAMRTIIAKRTTAAKRDIPHFYLSIDCELDALLDVRQQLNGHFAGSGDKVSVNDCIVKAAALALVAVPAANASWSEDAVHHYGTVDIAVAVATAGGLITPIVRNADTKPLVKIAREIKTLVARAHTGDLKPDEYQGGGFSISNLGMYGIKSFSAIINPPQSCILAVGAGEQRALVRKGKVEIGTVMTCTLSVDHRSVDGAVAAKLLGTFKQHIERPVTLLMEAP